MDEQETKDREFIKKHLLAEQRLNEATAKMERLSATVKELTKSVKKGTATKDELNEAIEKLKIYGGKIKIITAETKMFAGWTVGNENLPKPFIGNKTLFLIALAALMYLVKK